MADKMVQADKDAEPASGETKAAMASGGESQGSAYPNANSGKHPKQSGLHGHGGQTEMGYHGSGQLGDREVGEGNQNAPAKSADK
jgi:hypothetical protein